jgi:hypothetical protein
MTPTHHLVFRYGEDTENMDALIGWLQEILPELPTVLFTFIVDYLGGLYILSPQELVEEYIQSEGLKDLMEVQICLSPKGPQVITQPSLSISPVESWQTRSNAASLTFNPLTGQKTKETATV